MGPVVDESAATCVSPLLAPKGRNATRSEVNCIVINRNRWYTNDCIYRLNMDGHAIIQLRIGLVLHRFRASLDPPVPTPPPPREVPQACLLYQQRAIAT